jgi:hypothetical protein
MSKQVHYAISMCANSPSFSYVRGYCLWKRSSSFERISWIPTDRLASGAKECSIRLCLQCPLCSKTYRRNNHGSCDSSLVTNSLSCHRLHWFGVSSTGSCRLGSHLHRTWGFYRIVAAESVYWPLEVVLGFDTAWMESLVFPLQCAQILHHRSSECLASRRPIRAPGVSFPLFQPHILFHNNSKPRQNIQLLDTRYFHVFFTMYDEALGLEDAGGHQATQVNSSSMCAV